MESKALQSMLKKIPIDAISSSNIGAALSSDGESQGGRETEVVAVTKAIDGAQVYEIEKASLNNR